MFPRQNNLEWLRLLFALQVVATHVAGHLDVALPSLIRHFPGVPAFFFVSGFLIYASYQNAPGRTYFHNRFLRLYPGLIAVTVGGLVVVVQARGLPDLLANASSYGTWVAAQLTLGQAYNPEIFRGVGVGMVNGALWTLTVELLFYLMVPLIVAAERRVGEKAVLAFVAMSFAFFAFGPLAATQLRPGARALYDLLWLTPLAWGWMFGLGILAVKHFHRLRPRLHYFPLLVVALLALSMEADGFLLGNHGQRLGLLYFAAYAGAVLWLAFATPHVPLHADFSYGTYIWHMPVINLLLIWDHRSAPLAVALTFVMAALSWYLVERPALLRKKRSLKPLAAIRMPEDAAVTRPTV
jgi:peptidoglycan/LPS O-acetylase OafA/YrhL